MNQTYHEQHYATGHQPYGVPASYNAQQLAAQQQAQANAAAMYRIHNQWRRDKEEQLKDVVWGALAPGMQQCVRDMAAKSDEHSQELRDIRDGLTSTIASVSEKLQSFQESVVGQFGNLGADVQALKDEAQQMPRRFLSFEEDNERMRTSQECRNQELFARIDQLEKKMQLQSESILSCIQQLFEQAEIKNDQRQNKAMGMLGEVSAQNLSIQRYFPPELRDIRDGLTSTIASVSEKLHSFQESVVCQFGDLGADVQALKDEAQQMPRRFLSFEEDNERMRTSQECRDQELFARIDQLEKKMQLQSESILSCIQQLFEQAEIKNDQRQNKVMGMLGEVSAQNLSIQRYFSAPLSEPRMKTRSQGRRRSIGHELQDVPFVRAARDAVIKALKEDPSPRKLDKKDCPSRNQGIKGGSFPQKTGQEGLSELWAFKERRNGGRIKAKAPKTGIKQRAISHGLMSCSYREDFVIFAYGMTLFTTLYETACKRF
ncbi:hypothetical protein MAN_10572, partial [Metarhizium hybridum]